MDGDAQLVVVLIKHLVITKGDVAYGKVKEAAAVRRLEARYCNICLGIKLLCDAPRNAVQLHAVQTAIPHRLRQTAEEVAHAHCRLQNVARLKAHVADSLIDRFDNRGACVMGVQRRGPCSIVVLIRQEAFQLGVFRSPCGFIRVKGVGQAAPAHILR